MYQGLNTIPRQQTMKKSKIIFMINYNAQIV